VQDLNLPQWAPTSYNNPISNGWYYTVDGSNIKKTFLDIDTNNINTMPTAIALSGTDAYIAGAFSGGNQNQIATYWKNDINGAVALATGGDWSEATGIAISGTDVYVTGYEQCPNYGCIPTAKLWKNNMYSVVNLSDGKLAAQPSCLAINDTAQYVGGYQQNTAGVKQAMLWRVSGNSTTPIVLSNGITDAVVNGITVSDNDVFLAGYQIDPASSLRVATWWRVYGDIVSSWKLPSGVYFGAPDNSEANAIQVN
jgi:hypothetical protein